MNVVGRGDAAGQFGRVVRDVAVEEQVVVLGHPPAVVQVGRAHEQPSGLHVAQQVREIGPWLQEVLDHLAGDDDVEAPRGGEVRVDELGVVAQPHDVRDRRAADLRESRDVLVVEAPAGPEDEDIEIAPTQDVDRHPGHVELATLPLGRPDPGPIGEGVDPLEGAIVVRVVRVADVTAVRAAPDPELRRGPDAGLGTSVRDGPGLEAPGATDGTGAKAEPSNGHSQPGHRRATCLAALPLPRALPLELLATLRASFGLSVGTPLVAHEPHRTPASRVPVHRGCGLRRPRPTPGHRRIHAAAFRDTLGSRLLRCQSRVSTPPPWCRPTRENSLGTTTSPPRPPGSPHAGDPSAVIEDTCTTVTPVGRRRWSSATGWVSSATVAQHPGRARLNGYAHPPVASAGRIPTDAGYHFC